MSSNGKNDPGTRVDVPLSPGAPFIEVLAAGPDVEAEPGGRQKSSNRSAR